MSGKHRVGLMKPKAFSLQAIGRSHGEADLEKMKI